MFGHEEVIRMRSAGRKPACIFIEDTQKRRRDLECGTFASVCTHLEPLENIDLRFVVGCMVSIHAATERRAKALAEIAKREGATSVGCCSGSFVSIWHKDTGEVNG